MVHFFKRFRLNLVNGAYALALLAAFAFKPANVDTGLHWFEYDGLNIGAYIGTSTQELETAGCPEEEEISDICALGFDASDVNFTGMNPVLTGVAADDPEGENEDERYKPEPQRR